MPQLPPMIGRFFPRLAEIIAPIACAALGVLYWWTRAAVHTFDAVSYMWNVEAKPLIALYHPHHLLYAPLGQLAYRIAQGLGYTGHSDAPIQAVNALAGALGVYFLWRFGARWTGRPFAALGPALAMGLCYAYWLYASEVEVYTLAAAFLALGVWFAAALDDQPTPLRAAGLGLAHAGAIMFHQTNVMWAAPVLAFLLMRPALRRAPILAAYGLSAGLATLIPYGLVALASGLASPQAVFDWLAGYATTGRWGGYLSLDHLPALMAGLGNTIGGGAILIGAFYGLAGLGAGLGIWRARRDPRRAAWLGFAAVWLVVYGAFFWWWEPFNIEFWIALLPLFALLMMAGWGAALEPHPPTPTSPPDPLSAGGEGEVILKIAGSVLSRLRRWAGVLHVVTPFILAAFLYRGNVAPVRAAGDPANDYYYQVTTALQGQLASGDLVVTRGNILDIYVPFYLDHPTFFSLREATYAAGGDRAQINADLTARMDYSLATGYIVWIDQIVLDEALSADRNPFGLLPEEIAALGERYDLRPAAEVNGGNVWYATPRATGSDLTAWEFAGSLVGWTAGGVNDPRFEADRWCIDGGSDPQLISPILAVDAREWAALGIDMTLEGSATTLQVFWRGPGETWSLDRSVEISIRSGRRTYPIEPGWAGTIEQIRVDPIPGGEGESGRVCIHAIRLAGE